MTLLSDHSCKRGSFPTVSTHVLSEHTDEVWVLEWSHDGRFLATGGRDGQVVIWDVGVSSGTTRIACADALQPTPVRKCEKIASLSGHKDPISSIAYSPDDSRLVVTCENTFYLWDTKVRQPLFR
jgi:WD40 repeat protein